VKCVRRRALPEHERKALNAEMDIMLRLSHPNILKLLDSFKDREHLYMVVELARGGELFDRIVQKVRFNFIFSMRRYCLRDIVTNSHLSVAGTSN
jgi:serine/threonine protein kinase